MKLTSVLSRGGLYLLKVQCNQGKPEVYKVVKE